MPNNQKDAKSAPSPRPAPIEAEFESVAAIEELSRFERAMVVARRLHEGHLRKCTKIPYFAHLVSVAALVIAAGGDEDMAIAGLLHDAVEDQEVTVADIESLFGARIAAIVQGCTDVDDPTEDRGAASSEARKKRYAERLAKEKDPDVLRVSLADKLHNLRETVADYVAIGDEVWKRFNVDKEGSRRNYRRLAEVFGNKMPGDPQAEEFADLVEFLFTTEESSVRDERKEE